MSAPLQYYLNPLGSITYDAAGYVQLTWSNAPITHPELKSLYAHTLQALRHHGTCKLLTDQRHRQPLPEAEQHWIVQEWIPQAIAECAYSYCAIVESTEAESRQAARTVGTSLAHPLTFNYFQSLPDAQRWLEKA